LHLASDRLKKIFYASDVLLLLVAAAAAVAVTVAVVLVAIMIALWCCWGLQLVVVVVVMGQRCTPFSLSHFHTHKLFGRAPESRPASALAPLYHINWIAAARCF